MHKMLIAVPSEGNGGMDAVVHGHFGHCDCYTIVEVEEGRIVGSRVVENGPHGQGGCMVPVQRLAQEGVNVLLARGMGMRPFQGFVQSGVTVYRDTGSRTVAESVTAFLEGRLSKFGSDALCGGGGHCRGH